MSAQRDEQTRARMESVGRSLIKLGQASQGSLQRDRDVPEHVEDLHENLGDFARLDGVGGASRDRGCSGSEDLQIQTKGVGIVLQTHGRKRSGGRLTAVGVAIGAALAVILTPTAAQASDGPRYVLAAWSIGNPDSIWETPQELVTYVLLDEPSLDALDGRIPCGTYAQIDLYLANQDSAALLAGGVLYGPNNPTEPLAHGAVTGGPWKYLQTADCAVKPEPRPWSASSTDVNCEAATEHTADGFYDLTFDPIANLWTEDPDPTVVHEASSTRAPTAAEMAEFCAPEERLPTLADTGLSPAASWALILALMALVAGTVALIAKASIRRS